MTILLTFGIGVLVGFIIGGFYYFYKGYTKGYNYRKRTEYYKRYGGREKL